MIWLPVGRRRKRYRVGRVELTSTNRWSTYALVTVSNGVKIRTMGVHVYDFIWLSMPECMDLNDPNWTVPWYLKRAIGRGVRRARRAEIARQERRQKKRDKERFRQHMLEKAKEKY